MRNDVSNRPILRTTSTNKLRQAVIETCERRLLMSTYVVNTTSDAATPVGGQLTLRQAIADANASPGADTIMFSPSVFTISAAHTITLTQGQLNIRDNTTIEGPGIDAVTIDGNHASRVFQVSSGITVAMSGITIADGAVTSAASSPAIGGGIASAGALTLSEVSVSNNNVSGGNVAAVVNNLDLVAGAGIYNTGTLTVIDSNITGNLATGGDFYSYYTPNAAANIARGGGIYSSGALTISGSVISDNEATGGYLNADNAGDSAEADGGGVYVTGPLTMSSTTVSANTVQGGAVPHSASSEDSGAPGNGGGIYATNTTNISGGTFTGNGAYGGASGGGAGSAGTASGGAIFDSAALTISSANISGNLTLGGNGPFDDSGPGGDALGAGIFASAPVTVTSSTVSDNTATGGGGRSESFLPNANASGGGIYSAVSLTVITSTISGNSATADQTSGIYAGPGGRGAGGGIWTYGTSTITSSTVSGNTAKGGQGDEPYDGSTGANGGPAFGGGLYGQGDLTITNNTFAANNVTGGAGANGGYSQGSGGNGGAAAGGAIYTVPFGGEMNVYDSTVSGNTATGGTGGKGYGNGYLNGDPGGTTGAGITIGAGDTFDNDIVSGNLSNGTTEDDIAGGVGGSNNLIGTYGGDYIANGVNGNILGVDNPQLSPLGNYGGTTQTMVPLPNSPAINAGNNSLIPAGVTTDQRGDPRIVGSAVDIGSVEFGGTVSGNVYGDSTGGGTISYSPIIGVTLYADLTNSGYYQTGDPTVMVDNSGHFVFNNLPAGPVTIAQLINAASDGLRQTVPAGGAGIQVNVGSTPVTGVNFADTSHPLFSGEVTLNGVGVPNLIVYADLNNDGKFETNENNKLTATNGTFSFVSLSPGITYTFRVEIPTGDVQVTPASNAGITLLLNSGTATSGLDFALASAPALLKGAVIGTSGSYNNQGNTATRAFDGNLSTFFDAPTASGSWAGLNLGSPQIITQISYAPRSGWAGRMVGGMFQGSNSPTFSSGVVTLYTVTSTPATGVLTTVPISNTTAFQYVRYIGPANSYCDIAEAQFFGSAPAAGSALLETDGTLLVNGTSGNDNITILEEPEISASNLTVTINGAVQSFNSSNVSQIVVASSSGNDTINISGQDEGINSAVLPSISITAGDGNDTFIQNLNADQAPNYVQELISITAGNGNDTFQLNDSSVLITVVAGNGNDSFTTNIQGNGSLSAVITAGNGNDAFTAGSSGGSGFQRVTLNAGTGTDTVMNSDVNDSVSGSLNSQAFSLDDSEVQLSGKVYADLNGDGVYEPGEPLVAGAPVSFTFSSQEIGTGTYTTTSNSQGSYSLMIPTDQAQGTVSGYGQTFPIQQFFGEALTNVNIALPQPLGGTVIGTAGSYQNDGNTIAKAFDGNLNTFFDGPTANGNYAGRDLGTAQVITAIAYAPRAGWAGRMVGGVFQGSNSANFANAVNLYTVTATPATGMLTYVSLGNTTAYRYVRYLSPNGSYGDVAEMQFFGTAPTAVPLTGTIIGTAGSYRNHGTTIANAFDGNLSTYFDGPDASGDWVGLDLGAPTVVSKVQYAPRAGYEGRMVGGEIQASNSATFSSGVVTLYTISSTPTAGVLTTAVLNNTTAYRCYRYIGPANSYCDIAELLFES